MRLLHLPAVFLALVFGAALALATPEDKGVATESTLPFAGVSLIRAGGRVEVREPGKEEFRAPPEMPLPLGAGMQLQTGALSKATLEFEDGSTIGLASHGSMKIAEPLCRLEQGRIRALAAPRQVVALETAAVPVRVRGKLFSIEMPGKGKGKMAALGNGRATAAKLIAVKGFVEVQLPFGTVRAAELPLTLHEGSVVQTAANSYALISFPDGSKVKVRADSTAAVDTEHRCTIAAGAVDVMVANDGDLELRTLNRSASIRGPAFSVEVNPDGETAPPGDEPELGPSVRASTSSILPGATGWDASGGR